MNEVRLEPGWLMRDVKAAQSRLSQWGRPFDDGAAVKAARGIEADGCRHRDRVLDGSVELCVDCGQDITAATPTRWQHFKAWRREWFA